MKLVRLLVSDWPGLLIIFLLLASFSKALLAQPNTASDTEPAITLPDRAAIDRAVMPYVQREDFQGVIGVAIAGQEPRVFAYGFANRALRVAASEVQAFRIGSISKQFTAVAILKLAEAGKLGLDEKVGGILKDYPRGDEFTVRQLLVHEAGIADTYNLARYQQAAAQFDELDDVVAQLATRPLVHEPGAQHAYSNGGYVLLAAIIEERSGMRYGDYLRTALFDPLGLKSTFHDPLAMPDMRRASGYDPLDAGDLRPAGEPPLAYLTGPGSLWSTAHDLIRWNEQLHGGQVLTDDLYRELILDGKAGYGFGISVFSRFGQPTFGHDGRVDGFSSDLAWYRDHQLSVVVLSNVQSVVRDEVRREVAAIIFGQPLSPSPLADFAADGSIDPVRLQRLEGGYVFAPTLKVNVRAQGARLYAQANAGGFSQLVPLRNGRWFSRMLYATVSFDLPEQGPASAMLWGDGDSPWPGPREVNSAD